MAEMNVNTTSSVGLSPEIKTFYDKNLIKNTKPLCVYAKYGQQRDIPKKSGQSIEFRKMSPFAPATTPLTEGVTPAGNSINTTKILAKPNQYGDYVTLSDVIDITAIDNVVTEVQENQGNQAGETLDLLTGLALCCGTNVQYAGGVASRNLVSSDNKLTASDILKARTTLVNNKAAKFEGKHYIAIAHPFVCHDIMQDETWKEVNKYSKDGKNIYEGEVGSLYGITLIEDPNAVVFNADKLTSASDTLTIADINGSTINVEETITTSEIPALVGKNVAINGIMYSVVSATNGISGEASITLSAEPYGAEPGDTISGYGGGLDGTPVYPTLVFGTNAYGVTKIEGLGLETIVKPKGSGGTSDPLDQRSTVGWKASHCAEVLVQEFMVRIESGASTVA